MKTHCSDMCPGHERVVTPHGLRHSVVLSSYNRPKLVIEAIASIKAQSYQDFQVIVTDDASTSQTRAAIEKAIDSDRRFVVLGAPSSTPRPQGSAIARAVDCINAALRHVSGDVVHYLPDDDLFTPDRFAIFNQVFLDESVMVAYGMVQGRALDGKLAGGVYHPDIGTDPIGRLDHSQVAHRRDVLRYFPAWDIAPDGCMDGWWFMKLATRWRMIGVPELVAIKRFHGYNLLETMANVTEKREP